MAAIEWIARDAYSIYLKRLGKPPAPMIADFAHHVDQNDVLVFEQDGAIAGYAILLIDQQRALLDNIAVDPGQQRLGIGQALIEAVEQRAKAFGHAELILYTNIVMTENVRWYAKLGFVETGRIVEKGFRRIYMKRPISPQP